MRPSGKPWAELELILKFTTKEKEMRKPKDLKVVSLVTDEQDVAIVSYELPCSRVYNKAWVDVIINESSWSRKVSS